MPLPQVYAKPEEEIHSERDTLDHVCTFAVHALELRVAPLPWPRSDLPWGATAALAEAADAALRPPPRPPTGVATVRPKTRARPVAGCAAAEGGSEPIYTIVGDRKVRRVNFVSLMCF